jgi:hypothetical protein
MGWAMKLTADQQSTVRAWAEAGASLNEIQNQLRDEMELRLTFMDVRFLILDLGITLKSDPVEPEPVEAAAPVPVEEPDGVAFSADDITIPGAMASGKVTFSDGVSATWFLDQRGRFALQAADAAYTPPPDDVPVFQKKLQLHLQRMGMY